MIHTWLRTVAILAVCAALVAALLPLAIVSWQSRADLRGAVAGFRLAADRGAELVGETDVDTRGERFTVARLVASADGTVLLVRPVLKESATTIAAARQPLSEAAETIRAARPVLGAAKDALGAVPGGVQAAAGAIVEMRADLRPLLEYAANITGQVADAAPLWLDCDHNPNCAFNRYVGVARGVEQMALAWGKAAPGLTVSADKFLFHFAGITADAHTFTTKFVAPRPFSAKFWDGVKTGAYIAARAIP